MVSNRGGARAGAAKICSLLPSSWSVECPSGIARPFGVLRPLLSFVCAAWIWLASGQASATVGGPVTVSVLGYAPGDHKVYVVFESHGAAEDIPQLAYIPTTGKAAGRIIEVRSWYRDDDGSQAFREVFAARIEALRRRLRSGSSLRRSEVHLVRGSRKRIRWRADPSDPEVSGVRIQVEVKAPAAARAGSVRVESYGCLGDPELGLPASRDARGWCRRVRLVEAVEYDDVSLAVVESIGIPYEGGYAMQQPVVLLHDA